MNYSSGGFTYLNYINPFAGSIPREHLGITNQRHFRATPPNEIRRREDEWKRKQNAATRFLGQLDDAHPRFKITQLDFVIAGLAVTLRYDIDEGNLHRHLGEWAEENQHDNFCLTLSGLRDQKAFEKLYEEVMAKLEKKLERDPNFLEKAFRFKFSDEPEGHLTKLDGAIQSKLREMLQYREDNGREDIHNLTAGFRMESAQAELQGGELRQHLLIAATTKIERYQIMSASPDRAALKENEAFLQNRQTFLRALVKNFGVQPQPS
jgi:hypothetical protein